MTLPFSSDQPSPTSPKLPMENKGWLNRLQVGQKIGLGYALVVGIIVSGTLTGTLTGNRVEQHAHDLEDDAIEEILEINSIEQSLIQLVARERELITWLDQPGKLRENYDNYQISANRFKDQWFDFLAGYDEDIAAGVNETPEELAFIASLSASYPEAIEIYLNDVDQFIQDLDFAELQGVDLIAAQQEFITLNRRPAAIQLDEFKNQLSALADLIRTEELNEATEVVVKAAQIRLQVLIATMTLSLLFASFLALRVSSAINRPLKAVEEIALKVTEDKNFDLRAAVNNSDEIGSLAASLNQLIAWVGEHTDALQTTQQELESQAHELNAIIDNLGDGLLVTDAQGYITRSNPALRKMFNFSGMNLQGQPAQAIFNQHITDLIIHNQANPKISPSIEVDLLDDRVGQALVTAITSDVERGSERAPLPPTGSVVLIRDITTEKEVDQMKTDFISTVSHELRTPLTSVLGFAKLIQKKLDETVLPAVTVDTKKTERAVRQVRDNLRIILSEGDRLTLLINDVLDIAKIEAGKIEWNMQPIDISEMIYRAISAVSVLAQKNELEITCEIEPELPLVSCDRNRIIQVIINLLSNAIKFTDSGSIICRVQQQEGNLITSIVDTGIGLSTDDLEKVFDKFTQVGEVMTDKPKGTGLGLPICKQIIEHHGGRIWGESELGEGSTFTFTLPLSLSLTADATKVNLETLVQQLKENVDRAVPPAEKNQKTILVVDDEHHIRQLLRQELEAVGYQVQTAKDGMDAIQQIKVTPPDLIIMDVMMPNINGFDLAAVLKNNPDTMDIPTIVLSIIQDPERGYRLGVDRYLSKPINTEVLLHDIKTLLAQGKSHRQVLVVDMDSSTTQLLTEVLLSKGYAVTEATTGKEGIAKALALKPDMIIVDSSISTEHDLVKTLRFDNGLDNIFFIMVEQVKAVLSAD